MTEPDIWRQRYRMVYAAAGRHLTADEPELLLNELIDGYLDLPEHLRHRARIQHAERIRGRLQQRVLAAFGPSGLAPDELRAFLQEAAPTRVPASWSAAVPVILVDAHFADGPLPSRSAGRIVWLDTTNDDEYLRSLAIAGEIFLMIRQDPTAGDAIGGPGPGAIGSAVGA
ncbi:hypothetical protein [Phytohabitans kaempferiae]|uniref:DUF5753 domain-containing protein n=1 Tax=Phytohabitans kaempferiae TaxID=1620943 RepID=A0ABV6M8Z6_9ACTN